MEKMKKEEGERGQFGPIFLCKCIQRVSSGIF